MENTTNQTDTERKFGMTLFQLIMARMQSKTPSFFLKVRGLLVKFLGVSTLISAAFEANLFRINPETSTHIARVVEFAAAVFAGAGGATHLGTTDTNLMSPESKEAVIKEANCTPQDAEAIMRNKSGGTN